MEVSGGCLLMINAALVGPSNGQWYVHYAPLEQQQKRNTNSAISKNMVSKSIMLDNTKRFVVVTMKPLAVIDCCLALTVGVSRPKSPDCVWLSTLWAGSNDTVVHGLINRKFAKPWMVISSKMAICGLYPGAKSLFVSSDWTWYAKSPSRPIHWLSLCLN